MRCKKKTVLNCHCVEFYHTHCWTRIIGFTMIQARNNARGHPMRYISASHAHLCWAYYLLLMYRNNMLLALVYIWKCVYFQARNRSWRGFPWLTLSVKTGNFLYNICLLYVLLTNFAYDGKYKITTKHIFAAWTLSDLNQTTISLTVSGILRQ